MTDRRTRLELARETLRELGRTELETANGGRTITTNETELTNCYCGSRGPVICIPPL